MDADIGVAKEDDLALLGMQQSYISKEVRVRNLRICRVEDVVGEGHVKDWNVDGNNFRLLVRRAAKG